ncbi:DASS family sodium-coupled anion symporter [Geobacter sp. SVR]|uniref:DASS family sodium-coupled anion symporter n=1 Tax=Geobacter sp. SVR TaxID=2495594 RepID=UPI00143F007B|nr:DASS family sodium-coupled anion symporter [Geobacter sp. SVR]BCS53397.1 transporter [Geobacter sp. SVR]GCF85477.1 sodium/dicarboxylate or sulfate cotransporter [Geobacter sp. SVR]
MTHSDPFDKPLKIDNRPLWLVVLDRTARYQVIAALVLTLAVLFRLTPPQGLSVAGYQSLVLFGAAIFLWVSGLLPIAVTALLSMVSLPLLGIMDKKSTYALFGNEAVFFILGAFILAAALTGTGISARLARAMLVRFGKTPTRLAFTVFFLSALLSFVMSEHAVAAMMFPVIAEIATALKLEKGSSSYGRLLFMSIAWGCIIGGIATFLGGARAPLAVGMLRENTGLSFSFLEWSSAACMIVFPLLAIGFLLLLKFFPVDLASVDEGIRFLNRKRLDAGRIGYNEMITGVVMVVTVACWLILGERVGLASIAILGTAALFTFRVVTWQMVEEYVNWGIILMYGGSIALASALEKTGAAIWLVKKGMGAFSASPLAVIMVISLVSIVLTECISHAAVVAILMPIGMGLCKTIGMDPKIMTLSIALPAGLAYCLPMGTPATAIAYSSGFLKSRDIIVSGSIIMAISWVLFLISVVFVWPLLGFRV